MSRGSSDEDYQESYEAESESQAKRSESSSSIAKDYRRKVKKPDVFQVQKQAIKHAERPKRASRPVKIQEHSEDDKSQEEPQQKQEEDEKSIFDPDIEQILWRRYTETEPEYFVKYRNYSYLWCEWILESKILSKDRNARQKINRFSKQFDKKLLEMDPDEVDQTSFFDPSYIEIDRIISTTEIFPVIHQKKANEIKGKWNESLANIVNRILNFTQGRVKYGVYFMDPVNPEKDSCQDYRKIITQPMDLGTVLNRLYLDHYKNSQIFWIELGLVFKNCKKYNTNPECQLRILSDTLSELAILLYQQWHVEQTKLYERINYLSTLDPNVEDQELQKELQREQHNITFKDQWNPGPFSYEWIDDDAELIPTFKYTTNMNININEQYEVLYMVKWKNLSYLQATWENVKNLPGAQSKILEFRQFNRAPDKESRQQMVKNFQRHKMISDYEQKKKNKVSFQEVMDLKKQLYQLDIGKNKKPFHYTPRTQTIYKDRKLLRDYQLESLNWMIDAYYNQRNVLLADEMGLGKTIQSIAFLNHLFQVESCRGPFLIIAPLSTLQHWKRSAEDWTNLNAVLYYDPLGQQGREACRLYEWYYTDISIKGNILVSAELHKFQILITSYEVFNQDHANIIQQIPFQFIIVDEAHRLKNQNAKILASLKKLICNRVMILTGTPVQNNPEELWSLLNFIEPQIFPTFQAFKNQFGDLQTTDSIEKLNLTLKPYILRRQKEDVEQSIPPLQENIIDVEMTTVQKTLYRALYERNKAVLVQGFSQQTAQITSLNNLDMHLRKLCNHPLMLKEMYNETIQKYQIQDDYYKILVEWSGKMVLLDKMLKKFLKEEKKVLIFSQFTNMLALLEEYLKHNMIKYEKITGDVKSIDRQNAIDRFNDQKKGRQVFLLSTKAGGQGINLTAAEIVIIFDSDWNPQNDIQATARAHRIGQDKQVAVFRFITNGTYEQKMFERAVQKLGLDQAIFIGGEYKSTTVQQVGVGDSQKKLSKKDLEILLKQGSLGLLEQFNQNLKQEDLNIDEILNNSRVAKYSLINGSYTISKQSFVPDQSNKDINIDDPNFWQIVLKNHESKAQKLLKQIQEDENSLSNIAAQKDFMLKLAECINQIIESKLSMERFDQDDENTINDILNMIGYSKIFDVGFKNLSNNWIYEIGKPSRRFKKITEQDLEIIPTPIQVQKQDEKKSQNIDMNWSDYETQKKLEGKNKQEQILLIQFFLKRLSVRICYICEKPHCNYFCRGFCLRQFHNNCIDEQPVDEPNIKYLCKDCEKFQGYCFDCGKKGSFNPLVTTKKKKNAEAQFHDYEEDEQVDILIHGKRTRSKTQQFTQQSDLIKCCTQNCHKLYHFSCAQTNRNFKIIDGISQKFRCALHFCEKCKDKNTDDNSNMQSCIRCPRSFHQKCAPKNVSRVSKKYIICPLHKDEVAQPLIKRKPVKQEKEKNGIEQIQKKRQSDANSEQDN